MKLKPAVPTHRSHSDVTCRPIARAADAERSTVADPTAFTELTEELHTRLRAEEDALNAELLGHRDAFPHTPADLREFAVRSRALIDARLPALRRDVDQAFATLSQLDGGLDPPDRRACLVHHRALVQPYFMQTPWTRRVVERAFGYAGDYLVVEALFDGDRGRLGDTPMAQMMSRYVMATGPVRAHRDRLPWAHSRLQGVEARLGRPLRVLSVACGPERVLRAWLAAGSGGRLVLSDVEPRALAYCRRKVNRQLARAADGTTVDYVELSAMEMLAGSSGLDTLASVAPGGRFDAVLVLGLLDYLKADVVASLVDGLGSLLDADGELLLTNLRAGNPWRSLMEYVGDWFVCHRTAPEFEQVAVGSQSLIEPIELRTDDTGTNLFFAGRRVRTA